MPEQQPLAPLTPQRYQAQLADKVARLQAQFARFAPPALAVFESPVSHYRQRAEFKVWQEAGEASYAMFHPQDKGRYRVDQFPVASARINALMPQLLAAVNASEVLRRKLFQVEFLTTRSGQALITLIYHKPLDEQWRAEATALQARLGADLIGRSRKQKVALGRDYVEECLEVAGRRYHYRQVEGGFTQPNADVCEQMLTWACAQTAGADGDLLELYCGNGNFTVPLAGNFRRVLATEVSKSSVATAEHNFRANGVHNVAIARMSSEEFTQAMDGVRPFQRLRHVDLASYDFATIFVDPPRAGLDDGTVRLAARFDRILYISCNPATLADNLDRLCQSHRIERFAAFDQFPYTQHLECGVLLVKR